MRAAIAVEWLKLRRSRVGILTTLVFLGGLCVLTGGIILAVANGNEQMLAKSGGLSSADWNGLWATADQIAAAGGMLAAGVLVTWLFGREFTDGTLSGLFTLPAGPRRIAGAKLVLHLAWCAGLAVLTGLVLLLLGLGAGFGPPDAEAMAGCGRFCVLVVLTGVLVLPAAWVVSLSRSLLAGVGCVVGLVVVAQVGVLAGLGAWLPLAAPALWAMSGGDGATLLQLSLVPVWGAVFAWLILRRWGRLQIV